MRRSRLSYLMYLLVPGALCVAPALLEAQRRDRDQDRQEIRPLGTSRFALGGGLNYGRPVGDFYDYVEQGWGFDAFFRLRIDVRARWRMNAPALLSWR